ncbi:MAG: aminoacyl-histidine dipeptidase [Robiginitalea sp.]
MPNPISDIQPVEIWESFVRLNAVPRPSKKEERIIAFMVEFGHSLGLETQEDPLGNVLIRKPASPGMDRRTPVVLQAHLDMVHQKNGDTDFNFETEGIRMYRDGDWVKAEGTTLGADNGLGVAAIMGVLASDTISHPPLEALFTIDEETGMTGAKGLDPAWLKGDILLNLDTEEDDELDVGCAGGIDVTGIGAYKEIPVTTKYTGLTIGIRGLKGGHSGMDIHKGLGNSNVLLARMLLRALETVPFHIAAFQGGNLRNAIPREGHALIAVQREHVETLKNSVAAESEAIQLEYGPRETDLQTVVTEVDQPQRAMRLQDTENLLNCLYSIHYGVYAMSFEFPGLVETSNNLAKVAVENGRIHIGCLTRSSRETAKADLVRKLKAAFTLAGYGVETRGDYPGWLPDPDSGILTLVKGRYEKLFGASPEVISGHGGLECGILKSHYPQMDMISFGPTIRGAHSPDERASVSSVQKFWKLLLDVLAHIPE